ncbi:hypothetical protein DFA_05868 [Cavenderia fasciculata]|uniref:Uncharacterized protein n=1 Tax=Cavenderia fasciculata TaxID=261658 RepID=F4PN44_CACFS|nr:uncharacterized protein DFA_05868 [Cavenderia fasciculata]EGG23734.1 hypothetical protein DFA_05868 [Cavenderia fasciculata]|eukprot:XP_004361585.1 hypothetical protein DFA_05868 [Cavenderia fasciculata]
MSTSSSSSGAIGCPYHIQSVHKPATSNGKCPVSGTSGSQSSSSSELDKVVYLQEDTVVPDHPLTGIEYTNDDKQYMRIMLNHFVEFIDTQRRLSVNKPTTATTPKENEEEPQTSYVVNVNDQEKLRCIINNRKRALELGKYCVVGFFGTRSADNGKLDDIIESDRILVSLLQSIPGIVAYVTMQKDEPLNTSHLASPTTRDYGNIVILESFDVINEWRNSGTHREAVEILSPNYYHFVRIHNFCLTLPTPYQSMADYITNSPISPTRGDAINLEVVRTKYYSFKNDKVNWRGLRTYGEIVFTSFLSSNAYGSFKEMVDSIGKELNLKTRMVNIYELATKEHVETLSPRELMELYKIDYAFMCGASYSTCDSLLSIVGAPVRQESRYNDKPVYYSDIIVNSEREINNITDLVNDLKSFTFIYNEKASFSGYQLFRHELLHKLKSNSNSNSSSSTSTSSTSSSSSSFDDTYFNSYFKDTIKSGSHLESIKLVQQTPGSFATIDSTVLDTFNQTSSATDQDLRAYKVIGEFGPSPMPPLVGLKQSNRIHHIDSIKNYLTTNFTSSANLYKSISSVPSSDYNIFKKVKDSQ